MLAPGNPAEHDRHYSGAGTGLAINRLERGMAFDVKSLSQDQQIIAGTGVAAFIAGFFPGYGVDAGPIHASVKVWSMGISAKLGILLVMAAAAFVVLRAAGTKMPDLPAGPAFITLAASGLGSLFLLYRIIDIPGTSVHGLGYSVGRKWGLFLVVLIALVQTAVAFKAFKSSGEKAPNRPGTNSSS